MLICYLSPTNKQHKQDTELLQILKQGKEQKGEANTINVTANSLLLGIRNIVFPKLFYSEAAN
jgi:hypothetical protein